MNHCVSFFSMKNSEQDIELKKLRGLNKQSGKFVLNDISRPAFSLRRPLYWEWKLTFHITVFKSLTRLLTYVRKHSIIDIQRS